MGGKIDASLPVLGFPGVGPGRQWRLWVEAFGLCLACANAKAVGEKMKPS